MPLTTRKIALPLPVVEDIFSYSLLVSYDALHPLGSVRAFDP
ncbi:hypothetical protein EMIT093MI4_10676 [Pseudomonas sp. IT-93MI4]